MVLTGLPSYFKNVLNFNIKEVLIKRLFPIEETYFYCMGKGTNFGKFSRINRD